MGEKEFARRRATGGRGPGERAGAKPRRRSQYSTPAGRAPVALAVRKGGRLRTVGKLVHVGGRLVLAIAWRHQRGTRRAVSVPLAVLDYAGRAGAAWLYLRNDRLRTMGRIRLVDMRRLGWEAPSHGIPEMFVGLEDLEPTPWRRWAYTRRTVLLEPEAEPQGDRQLALGLGGGVT